MNAIFTIIHIFGVITIGFSGLMLSCFALSKMAHDSAGQAFWLSSLVTLALGLLMLLPTLRTPKKVTRQAGFLLVAFTWVVISAICTLPLLFYFPQISFIDAYFEMVSALTTTGATVLSGLDHLPMSMNLWRHELNWIGGMGIIVFAVAILPILGVGGMQLYKSEAPGTVKESDLPPRIAQTAKALWQTYALITVVCIVCLRIAGMGWFDAVCHAFSAMSLGGFSTHDASVGYFDSFPIEMVLTVFQLLAAMNFASHFLAFRKRSLQPYWHDMEAKAILTVVSVSCLFAAAILWQRGTYPDFWLALRHASFNLITIATDCGYASQDFNTWPIFVPMWMLFLSCIVSSSGSTGGGIRMIRTIILIKQARLELFKFIHPAAIKPIRIGDHIIKNDIVTSVMGFIFLYFISIVVLVFALMLGGLDFISAFTAIIACFNNAGPGLNEVGPATNYASLTDFETVVCVFAMILGRVQIFSIAILFIPEFWKR